ncbi:MAG TPA: phosphoenolpyruvate carboxylase [Polyangiaceae bacterium]
MATFHGSSPKNKELLYDERVLTRYRLYSGLFLGLPFEHLQQAAQLLPVFGEHCRRCLTQGLSPDVIVDRFFAETALLADYARKDIEFLFLQLVERQIVLFDALEDAGFTETHDLEAPGSVTHLAESVARDDRNAELSQLLERTSTRIVLTAHPTQFYPATVQGIIADLRGALLARESAEVERLLLQLGKTRFTNRNRPTPVEEAARVLDVVADVFYEILPEVLGRTLVAAHGRERLVDNLPEAPNLQIGFWPGGDRDGNPFVTADVTDQVAQLLKLRLINCYIESAMALSRRLTFEGAHEAVLAVAQRLRATQHRVSSETERSLDDSAYEHAQELMNDILAIRELVVRKHQALFVEHIDEFLIKVHVFGFYFASLDVRQNSEVFADTLHELARAGVFRDAATSLGIVAGQDWTMQQLEDLIASGMTLEAAVVGSLSPLARDTLETFRLIPKVQKANGASGLHRVVISHTRGAEDVLSVMALARLAGLDIAELDIDIVPLFESIEDLERSGETLGVLFASQSYRAHLHRRGNRQTVMVGFSDGTKDGGYLTANLAIRQAKRIMTAEGRAQEVELVFFDGRGGPPARGGGNTHRFYRSRDLGIDQWHQQLTIQGQTISSNFGSADSARHHVEQLFTANLENLLWPESGEDPPRQYQSLLSELSTLAHVAYTNLSHDPLFVDFLSECSPLPLFEHLTIGSRPVSRKRSNRLELDQLRAIPFVATWSVLKMQVPGYYGLGTACSLLIEEGREAELRNLYRDSRFFRTLLDNAAMSLLKSRFDIHAYLSNHEKFGNLLRHIRDEAERSRRCILQISQQPRLLANDPISRMSIEMREQIVLPLLVIVQASYLSYLEHQRKGTEATPEAQHLRKLSVKGIAAIINATRNAA